jgi:hypothetical protein
MTTYVYLKTQNNNGNDLTKNVIPLNVTSVSVSVSKTIPSFPVPLSGIATGESITAALDLGMADKSVSIQGIILDTLITKTIDKTDITRKYSAHEVAQMIASGVDSTSLAKSQAFSELVILYPSLVADDHNYRGTCSISDNKNKTDCESAGGTWTQTVDENSTRENGTNIPFNFSSRGDNGKGDNEGVPAKISSFPDVQTDTGLTGFIRSFSFDINSESYEISFSLEFQSAQVAP